jgi:hypothetical protein
MLEKDQGVMKKDQGLVEKDQGIENSGSPTRDNTNGQHQGTTPMDNIKGQHQWTTSRDQRGTTPKERDAGERSMDAGKIKGRCMNSIGC